MESYMKKTLERKYDLPKEKIVCLNIPDIFDFTINSKRKDLEDYLEKAFSPILILKILSQFLLTK